MESAQWRPLAHLKKPRWLQLQADAGLRVHSGCDAVAAMRGVSWFVLPPGQEYFYRRHHPEYRPLPPWRADCLAGAQADDAPIELLYPQAGSQVYIPAELDGLYVRNGSNPASGDSPHGG